MRLLLAVLFMPAAVGMAADSHVDEKRTARLLGFGDEASETQRRIEAEFDESLSASDQDEWLRRLSAKPHHVGSAAGRENARYIAGLFRSWGFDVEIEEYEILLPTPVTRELELVAPQAYEASLEEDPIREDADTSVRDELLPPYNAFSTDGEVEGELVFVNYGVPEDYELLERHGISVGGKIAIAKYGKSWRGIKPKLAGEKGAVGTIIYSDPADDGYALGDPYPRGPFKHESGVQRGSVMDMPTYPGDVLTPGAGATKRAKRLKIEDSPTITKIPVLPVSQRDALPLLAGLDGAVAPPEWRGALPITYHLGPGPAKVRLKVAFNWDRVTAYNVIARLAGDTWPDEWIIRGNHHDGWNHGAADPLSGMVAMLAEAKSVAALARAGRRPARTIIYAAWDAEEPGLIGSTEWAEHHADELRERTVAYLNTDSNSRGFVSIGGSHVLERFFNQVAEDVLDPQTDVSLKKRRKDHLLVTATDEKARDEAEKRNDLRIYPLGSGSDYTPFLQHLGIASANLGFGGEGEGGSYHTLYDTYRHYTTWRDPGLAYGVALAKVGGRATLRLANAPRLPFEFAGFADNISLYVSELEELADSMRKQTALTNRLLENGSFATALDPTKTLGPPAREAPVPHFNFAPLKNAVLRLQEAAAEYEDVMSSNDVHSPEINRRLYMSERVLTREQGLSGRPWYKHHIYAPGFYTGYGVKTIPGVREAIEQRQYESVGPQVALAAAVLNDMAAHIEAIAAMGSDQDTLQKLNAARIEYESDPADADGIIWYGRRMAYTGDYRSAIRIFSEGIARHPRDARMYRHRGHRYISVREFDRAIEDLEFAARLIEGKEDSVEPDGMPNALNIPVSTLHGNIWYHLGLARYLKHDWENAYRAFQAGFDTGGNDDNRVSTTHWRYMILRRMGRDGEAERILDDISADMHVIENTVYHRLCLFYKGELSLAEMSADDADNPTGAAGAYGVANWYFYNGDTAEAERRLAALIDTASRDSFGYIAAEADLARMKRGGSRAAGSFAAASPRSHAIHLQHRRFSLDSL